MAAEAVFSRNSIIADVLKPEQLQAIWDQHQSGARDHSVFLWGIMMLHFWERIHHRG